mgnify:CR=1 FL=1
MNITEVTTEGLRRELKVVVGADELEQRLSARLDDLSGKVRIKGFRPGHVPKAHLRKVYGRSVMAEVLQQAVTETSREAISQRQERPAFQPNIALPEDEKEIEQIFSGSADLAYTMSFEVLPKFDSMDFGKIAVEKPVAAVTAEDIDKALDRLSSANPLYKAKDGVAAEGDRLIIDFKGSIDGEAFEGGTSSDFLLELGSGQLIEGFEDGLTGASAGDERTVEVTFPDDYGAEHLAGKPATFAVTVKEVREKQLPDLDDDFAADNSDFDTLAELREDIEHRLSHAFEHRAEHAFRDAALEAAVDNATVEIPEEIVAARATEVWERVERSLASRGMDPEMYLKIQGKSREEAIEEAREDAEAGLRREAVLAAVADAEGIEATEEDMLEALRPPAGEKGKPEKLLKRLRADGRDGLLAEEIRMRRAADLVVDEAKPIEMDRAEAREKLWTPEAERRGGAGAGGLWTPGDS